MSGSASGEGNHDGGQLYGEHDSVFFQSPACGGGDDVGVTPSAYSTITNYLQGLLNPAELARPPSCPAAGQVICAAAAPSTANSSTSSEAVVGPRGCKRGMPAPEEGDEDGLADHGSCRSAKKEQEKKGKGEKKARGSRVAFATKSEVDHLDDGYRWRKYGQKAVKNSSFPRSYYRCTAAQCGVKKLVERLQQDPSTVVTTYEGRHGHPSPITAHRGARMLMATSADTVYSLAALQHHQHGFFPTGTDVYTSSVAHRVSEYGGIQFHADLLPDATMGYQQGYR
ncbi:WRKY transcription factor 23-like [Triticum dicoccoides]|uniref:WRKY transcription factor 23-like n=1 Tax=Triticum dicoccoides TaxID=85692 RepID=UPI0018909C4B|nr:WRKY transcription factor 23-like [Triticum dicoccoides]XP_044451070.1 WRKY transcription factor 23-like [Triticum aestivum]